MTYLIDYDTDLFSTQFFATRSLHSSLPLSDFFFQRFCPSRTSLFSFISGSLTQDLLTSAFVRAAAGTRCSKRRTSPASLLTRIFTSMLLPTRSRSGCWWQSASYHCTNASNISRNSSYQAKCAIPWRFCSFSRYSPIIMDGGPISIITTMIFTHNGTTKHSLR